MQEPFDAELLRQYAEQDSDSAFAALVTRHVNLVYSAAIRKTRNPHAAEEITQAVFIILAKKARALRRETVLSGWLYQTARLTAANFLRSEIRRARREQESYMQSLSTETEAWPQIETLLDDAMGRLNEKERNAIVLRFFEGKSFQEIGAAFGGTENAAKKRVLHGLEKLRKSFSKRGVESTAAAIAETISAHSVQTAPVALAKSVTAVAIAKGSIATASTLTLVKGTLKLMTWIRLKFALGMGAVVLLAGGAITVALSQSSGTSGGSRPTPQTILKQEHDAYAALSSYSDDSVTSESGDLGSATTTSKVRLSRPNLYRIEWEMTAVGSGGRPQQSKGAAWSAGNGDFLFQDRLKNSPTRKMPDLNTSLSRVTGLPSDVAKDFFGTSVAPDIKNAIISNAKLLKDENIGGDDCYVIMSSAPDVGLGTSLTTIWIGKKDFLIRKLVEAIDLTNMKMPSDAKIAAMLKQEGQSATADAIATRKMQIQQEQAKAPRMIGGKKMTTTKTHENISANPSFSKDDFVYVAPAGATP